MVAPMTLTYKMLFSSVSTFETLPNVAYASARVTARRSFASSSMRATNCAGCTSSAGSMAWRAWRRMSRASGRTVPCSVRNRSEGCGLSVIGRALRGGGAASPPLAPEHVLQDERAIALDLRIALGIQEGADIRKLVVRVLPCILLLKPFEALHQGQPQELERIDGAACCATGGKPGLHQIELTIRREQRVQTRLIVVKRHSN